MNIATLTRMPDEDALAPKARDRDAGARAEAFEGEMKGAEGRARTKADDGKETRATEADGTGERPAGSDRADGTEPRGTRDVLDLLAAVSLIADGASVTPGAKTGQGSRAPSPETTRAALEPSAEAGQGEGAWKGAGGLDGLAREWIGVGARPAEAQAQDRVAAQASTVPSLAQDLSLDEGRNVPRSRLVVARQETHFEPVLGQAVLVEAEEPSGGDAASSKAGDIVRLLDAKDGARVSQTRAERSLADPARVSEAAVKTSGQAQADTVRSTERGGASSAPVRGDADGEALAGAAQTWSDDTVSPSSARADGPAANAKAGETARARRAGGSDERPAASFAAVAEPRSEASAPGGEPVSSPVFGATSGAGPSQSIPAVSVQVAERIIDAFGGPSANRPADEAPTASHLRLRAGGAALKTLTIQLQPENLGLLHVSMRLHEGQLMLEIAADRVETARMLGEDRASLRTLLEKAGFSLEETAIVVAVRETGPAGAATPAARDGAANPDGRAAERGLGQSGGQGNGGEGERGRPDNGARDEAPRRRAEEPAPGRSGPRGTTFL